VGVCYLVLSDQKGHGTWDYTVPFPVAQERRVATPPYRWSEKHPAGTPDAEILEATATPSSVSGNGKSDGGGGGLSTGGIVGTVLGVLLGICLSAVAAWLVWRRERRKTKKARDVASDNERHGAVVDMNGNLQGSDGVELTSVGQRGAVVRQVEPDEDGEVPPAYHEVVKIDAYH
jgi:hypothetical protein